MRNFASSPSEAEKSLLMIPIFRVVDWIRSEGRRAERGKKEKGRRRVSNAMVRTKNERERKPADSRSDPKS